MNSEYKAVSFDDFLLLDGPPCGFSPEEFEQAKTRFMASKSAYRYEGNWWCYCFEKDANLAILATRGSIIDAFAKDGISDTDVAIVRELSSSTSRAIEFPGNFSLEKISGHYIPAREVETLDHVAGFELCRTSRPGHPDHFLVSLRADNGTHNVLLYEFPAEIAYEHIDNHSRHLLEAAARYLNRSEISPRIAAGALKIDPDLWNDFNGFSFAPWQESERSCTYMSAMLYGEPGNLKPWQDVAEFWFHQNDVKILRMPDGSVVIHDKKMDSASKFFAFPETPNLGLPGKAVMKIVSSLDPEGKRYNRPIIFDNPSQTIIRSWGKEPHAIDADYPVFEDGAWKPLRDAGELIASERCGVFECSVRKLINPGRHFHTDPAQAIYTLTAVPTDPMDDGLESWDYVACTNMDGTTLPLSNKHIDEKPICAEALVLFFNVAGINATLDPRLDKIFVRKTLKGGDRWVVRKPYAELLSRTGTRSFDKGKGAVHFDDYGRIAWIAKHTDSARVDPTVYALDNRKVFSELAWTLDGWGRQLHGKHAGLALRNGYLLRTDGSVVPLHESPVDDFSVPCKIGTFIARRTGSRQYPFADNPLVWQVVCTDTEGYSCEPAQIAFIGKHELSVRLSLRTPNAWHDGFLQKWTHDEELSLLRSGIALLVSYVMDMTGRRISESMRKKLGLPKHEMPETGETEEEVISVPGTILTWVGQGNAWSLMDSIEEVVTLDRSKGTLSEAPVVRLAAIQTCIEYLEKHLEQRATKSAA